MADTHHEPNQHKPNDHVSKQPANHNQPHVKCPRCHSDDTRFCYFNNYSFLQPRYHCKTCKRFWTQGGALRNVPVGGSKRSKRSKPNANLGIMDFDYASVPKVDASFLADITGIDSQLTANFGAHEQMMVNDSFVDGNGELGDWSEIYFNNNGAIAGPSGSGFDHGNGSELPPDL